MAKITVAWCAECQLYMDDLEMVGKPCGLSDHFTSSGKVPIYRRRRGWRCEQCYENQEDDLYFDYKHYRDHIQLDHREF